MWAVVWFSAGFAAGVIATFTLSLLWSASDN